MSIKLMTKAWDTKLGGNDKLVLLALCDYANDNGECFPSLNTICDKTGIGKTTLSYILRAYESIGVISRDKRKRNNNSDTSTLYKIHHLDIDIIEYKKEYQNARKYTKKSQCEHPPKVHNVNTQSSQCEHGTSQCEHLEPSINRHTNRQLKIYKKDSDKSFSFTLKKNTQIENLSEEYKKELKAYIETTGKDMSYDDFYSSCEMKGYKYKNFKLAYDKWNKKTKAQVKQIDTYTSRTQKNNDAIAEYYANKNNTAEIFEAEVIN